MVQSIVGSILHGGPIELFLVSTSGESNRSWCSRSSVRSFMVDPLSYFSFQPVVRAIAHAAWIVGSILHGGPIELFIVSTSGDSNRSWCSGSLDRSFMVEPLSYFLFQPVVRAIAHGAWIVGSILHGGPIELFLVSTSGESNRSWCVDHWIDPSWWTH